MSGRDFTFWADTIGTYGFPVIALLLTGYFIWYIWKFVQTKLLPEIEVMHMALIRVIDQTRMLDQDLIRLQQKVDTVLEYKENEQRRKAEQSSK